MLKMHSLVLKRAAAKYSFGLKLPYASLGFLPATAVCLFLIALVLGEALPETEVVVEAMEVAELVETMAVNFFGFTGLVCFGIDLKLKLPSTCSIH